MARTARLDAPWFVYHVMICGTLRHIAGTCWMSMDLRRKMAQVQTMAAWTADETIYYEMCKKFLTLPKKLAIF